MRYTRERRHRNATGASGEMRAVGAKLLGELQAIMGPGVTTLKREQRLADGSLVRASFWNGQPIVEYFPASGGGSKIDYQVIHGLAVQPRTFADANAFGANPEAILMPRAPGTVDARWNNYLYDDTYLDGVGATATGYYKRGRGVLFETVGLPGDDYTGLIDWRSADEKLSVCWHGPQSRYFPIHEPFEQGREFIYYNGQTIVDTYGGAIADPGSNSCVVVAAAINGEKLLAVTVERDLGVLYIRAYKFLLEIDFTATPWLREVPNLTLDMAPRLKAITTSTNTELLLSVEYDELDGFPVPLFKFNQSANEARAIVHTPVFDDPPGQDYLRVSEFVIDFRAYLATGGAVTHTDDVLVNLRDDRTTITTCDSARINAYNQIVSGGPNDGDESYFLDPYTFAMAGGNARWLVLEGSRVEGSRYTDDDDAPVEWYKGGVDYVDDVPVYVEFRTPVENYTLTASGTATGNRTRLENGAGSWTGDDLEAAATLTVEGVGTDERTAGLRCKDALGATWLEVLGTRTRSETYNGSSSITGGHFENSGGVGWNAGDYTASISLATSDERMDVSVLYLDLRYKCAAYVEVTKTVTFLTNTEWTAALESGSFRRSYTRTGLGGGGNERTTDYHGEIRVMMYGVEVYSGSGDKATASVATSTSGSDATTTEPYDFDLYGWAALGYGLLPFREDTIYPAQLAAFPTDYNSPSTGFPAVDNSSTDTAPFGVYYWELNDDPVNDYAGSWPWSKHLPSSSVSYGAWGCLAGGWVYSMADMSGTSTTEKWMTDMSDGADADALTGKHGLDSLGKIWPMSQFVSNYQRGQEL